MTTYLITEAQRDSIENLLAEVGFDKRPLVKVSNMLQSLPKASAEPVAWRTQAGNLVPSPVESATVYGWQPLYTSPQALKPITADDVTDEMLDAIEEAVIARPDYWEVVALNRLIAAAYNAVIKHKVTK